MSRSLLFPILLLLPLVATAKPADPTSGTQKGLADFTAHVNHYVEIHSAVAASLDPEILCSTPEELLRQGWAFAAAIRQARPAAREGEIFTPDVAAFFRAHISAVVRETGFDVSGRRDDEVEDGLDEAPWLEINGPFPWNAGSVMWPSMLWRLPLLPEELEYRFVGRSLVLLDVRASLVVDVLWDALPMDDRSGPPKLPWQPCDVHSELPACWM